MIATTADTDMLLTARSCSTFPVVLIVARLGGRLRCPCRSHAVSGEWEGRIIV